MLISWILSQSQILFDFFYWFAVNDQPFTTRDKLIPKKLMQNSFSFSMLWECSSIPWTQNVNRTSIRRSEDVLDVFWTYYISSIYALCLGCNLDIFITFLATIFSDHKRFLKIYRLLMCFQRSSWKFLKISKSHHFHLQKSSNFSFNSYFTSWKWQHIWKHHFGLCPLTV